MPKQEVPMSNIFQDSRDIWWKTVYATHHSKVIKGELPCRAVVNNMYVDEIPTELSSLEKLQQIRIAQWIVFEKIVAMHKGQ